MITYENKEYYTVPEVAKILGISNQAAYKKVQNSLSSFYKEINGQKYISADFKMATDVNHNPNNKFNIDKTNQSTELISALKAHITSLEKQNDNLNEQMNNLHKQIEQLTYALVSEQQRVKELLPPRVEVMKSEHPEQNSGKGSGTASEQPQPEKKQKNKSFFRFWRKKTKL